MLRRMNVAMRSPIRALLVALVTMLGVVLVLPSTAEAKPKPARSHTTTRTASKSTTHKTTTTKRVVKRPWKKGHAKAHAAPHRIRKSPAAKHHPKKG